MQVFASRLMINPFFIGNDAPENPIFDWNNA
ncbi:MAG: hypothetical protein RL710_646 [Pseudomonadota bacterium]|jgi:hypothetical protein